MAFPNTIETGADDTEKARLGLAGPTADIGHKPAHASAGLPAMLIALQTAIGVNTAPVSFTPAWTTSAAPATSDAWWCKIGKLVWFNAFGSWSTSVNVTSSRLRFAAPAQWGTLRGPSSFGTGYVWSTSAGNRFLPVTVYIGSDIEVFWHDTNLTSGTVRLSGFSTMQSGDYVQISGVAATT